MSTYKTLPCNCLVAEKVEVVGPWHAERAVLITTALVYCAQHRLEEARRAVRSASITTLSARNRLFRLMPHLNGLIRPDQAVQEALHDWKAALQALEDCKTALMKAQVEVVCGSKVC